MLSASEPEWEPFTWRPENSNVDQRVVFMGDNLEGVALEVVAVEQDEDEFLVIHAMNLRNRLRTLDEEARAWEK